MPEIHRRYDKHYFDKWYRNPVHRVSTPASTRRKAHLALAVAEYYLESPVRTVLDIGCGEGQWHPILKTLRPGIRYTGIDSSEYAIRRYGRTRNILPGTFAALSDQLTGSCYDLIICSDLLYYLPDSDLSPGLGNIAALLNGVAFLEAYPTDIELKGDIKGIARRNAAFYRRIFRKHGLVACGTHCYVGPTLAERVTALERGNV